MNRIKSSFITMVALAALALGTGCAHLQPGADPLVVRAEQLSAGAFETFDLFLHVEYDHSEELKKLSPDFHRTAELLRRDGLNWVQSLRTITKSYKANRTPENKASLVTWTATVERALQEAQNYLIMAQQRTALMAVQASTPVSPPRVPPSLPAPLTPNPKAAIK